MNNNNNNYYYYYYSSSPSNQAVRPPVASLQPQSSNPQTSFPVLLCPWLVMQPNSKILTSIFRKGLAVWPYASPTLCCKWIWEFRAPGRNLASSHVCTVHVMKCVWKLRIRFCVARTWADNGQAFKIGQLLLRIHALWQSIQKTLQAETACCIMPSKTL